MTADEARKRSEAGLTQVYHRSLKGVLDEIEFEAEYGYTAVDVRVDRRAWREVEKALRERGFKVRRRYFDSWNTHEVSW